MRKARGFVKDMSRTDLLSMRDGGMGNAAIAKSVGCSTKTIFDIIGPQPPEITKRNRQEAMARASESRRSKSSEGGDTTERKMKSFMLQREQEEPKRAVLVMKTIAPQPIPLHGEFMDYMISADRTMVDVETEQGRCLMQIPVEKIGMFIDELDVIRRNAASGQALPFWG